MSIITKIKLGLKLPPSVMLKKAKSIALKKFKTGKGRKTAYLGKTYYNYPALDIILNNLSNGNPDNFGFFKIPEITVLNVYKDKIFELSQKFLAHKFSLLGSGWVNVTLNCECPGFEGYNYTNSLQEIDQDSINSYNAEVSGAISKKISGNYRKIDWQLDFRSGYRWSGNTWYKDIEYGTVPGADIKIPWELGRMQHLIFLAYSYILSGTNKEFSDKKVYAIEFENQLLDFIAHNPPEFGVQWVTSMDVAIRAVNWLISYEYFLKAGYKFSDSFNRIFWESIYQHGRHIAHNLEWADGMRANHYLANITGLLTIAAYLPPDDEINTWLGFAMQEYEKEIFFQFYPDGGNFEASTAYHLLSSELAMFSFLISLKLGNEKAESLKSYISSLWKQTPKLELPARRKYNITQNNSVVFNDSLINRLKAILNFGVNLIKENGAIEQFGDNDSGRLIKLSPFDYENNIDKTWLKNLVSGLIVNNSPVTLEANFSRQFLDNFKIRYDTDFEISTIDSSKLTNVNIMLFRDFGLYFYHTRYYRAVLRCGSIGQNGKGGHAHNDQLSLLLSINGKDIFTDPGTYNYTAMPHLRNKYRSTGYHSTLVLPGHEQNDFPSASRDGLFWLMGDGSKANVLKATEQGFIGEHFGFRASHRRTVNFELNTISGFDYCNIGIEKKVHFYLAPEVEIDESERKAIFQRVTLKNGSSVIELSTTTDVFEIKTYQYSPEYGIKVDSSVIVLDMKGISSSWNIEIISV